MCWFTPKMPAIANVSPGQSQDSGTPSSVPQKWHNPKSTWAILCCLPIDISTEQNWKFNCWDSMLPSYGMPATDSGFTRCVLMLAPKACLSTITCSDIPGCWMWLGAPRTSASCCPASHAQLQFSLGPDIIYTFTSSWLEVVTASCFVLLRDVSISDRFH